MKVKVRLFANFREVTRKKELELDTSGDDIKSVIGSLILQYPPLEKLMLSGGEVKPYVNVLVNGKNISETGGLSTRISNGDDVAIFPPVSGG